MTISDFMKEQKEWFDSYRKVFDWNGYAVFCVWLKANEGACVGYPQYALEKDGKIRLSTIEETTAIMKLEIGNSCDDEETE